MSGGWPAIIVTSNSALWPKLSSVTTSFVTATVLAGSCCHTYIHILLLNALTRKLRYELRIEKGLFKGGGQGVGSRNRWLPFTSFASYKSFNCTSLGLCLEIWKNNDVLDIFSKIFSIGLVQHRETSGFQRVCLETVLVRIFRNVTSSLTFNFDSTFSDIPFIVSSWLLPVFLFRLILSWKNREIRK